MLPEVANIDCAIVPTLDFVSHVPALPWVNATQRLSARHCDAQRVAAVPRSRSLATKSICAYRITGPAFAGAGAGRMAGPEATQSHTDMRPGSVVRHCPFHLPPLPAHTCGHLPWASLLFQRGPPRFRRRARRCGPGTRRAYDPHPHPVRHRSRLIDALDIGPLQASRLARKPAAVTPRRSRRHPGERSP